MKDSSFFSGIFAGISIGVFVYLFFYLLTISITWYTNAEICAANAAKEQAALAAKESGR